MIQPLLTLLFWLASAGVDAGERLPLLEVEFQPERPYVQAQVEYILRLYRESHLQRGDFLLPEIPDTIVEPLEEGEPVAVTRNGREIEMVVQRYLLFPLRSGTIRIPAPLFSSGTLFVQGEDVVLEVQPRKGVSAAPWLPASALTLDQHWPGDAATWRAGEQRTRVVRIEARGLTAAQLPPLPLGATPGMRVYRVAVKTEDRLENGQMIGQRTERHQLIPTEPGTYRLPAIRLPWWNKNLEQAETTQLTEIALLIQPAETQPQRPLVNTPPDQKTPAVEFRADTPEVALWLLSASLLGVTALVLRRRIHPLWVRLHRYYRRRSRLRALRRACTKGDARSARDALLGWAASCSSDDQPRTLPALAARLERNDARQAILQIDALLYAQNRAHWDGTAAAKTIALALRASSPASVTERTVIPTLNP